LVPIQFLFNWNSNHCQFLPTKAIMCPTLIWTLDERKMSVQSCTYSGPFHTRKRMKVLGQYIIQPTPSHIPMHVGKITKLKTLLDLFSCYPTLKKFCCNEKIINKAWEIWIYHWKVGREGINCPLLMWCVKFAFQTLQVTCRSMGKGEDHALVFYAVYRLNPFNLEQANIVITLI
jgi:hypothetical protein